MVTILILLLMVFAVALIWVGSDWVTDSLIPVAHKLGTSYIAVTTLMISFTLSVPEIFSAVYSFLMGHVDIGLGVIIGSVMINIGMTVGLSAMIKPLFVEKLVVIRDGIFLIIVAVIVMLMGSDLNYSRSEGIILLLLFIPYVLNVWTFEKSRTHKSRKEKVETMKHNLDRIGGIETVLKPKPSLFIFILGELMLFAGSYFFSFSLVNLSYVIALPEIILGVLIGAVGTEIPNIAAAVQGTLKGFKDAAITETFGSNIFTLLVTLGVFLLISPLNIEGKVFYFDLTWMIIIHLLMLAFIFKGYRYKEASLTRLEGTLLLLFYFAIVGINILFF
ncbi:sodium:calcium antiporter [Candidatus Woesearchaeota archaeon]|nr:sodium:calcium antiporter [Candidatus Woesearchaeota archaeon]